MNVRSEVSMDSCCLSQENVWINEVDTAKTIHELRSSNFITGEAKGDFEVLDSKVASGIEKIIDGDFKK